MVNIRDSVIIFNDAAFEAPFEQGTEAFRLGTEQIVRSLTVIHRRKESLLKWRLKSSVVRYYNGISYLDQY